MAAEPTPDHQPTSAEPRLRRRWLVWCVMVLVTLTGLSLGVWQLQRAAQKVAARERVLVRASLPPLSLNAMQAADFASSTLANTPPSWLDRRAVAHGVWLTQHSVWLLNREQEGMAGYWLVTPLQLDSGLAVLVLRGWRAREADRFTAPPLPSSSTPAEQAAPVTVEGTLLAQVPRLFALGADDAHATLLQNLDTLAYARAHDLKLLPVVLRQERAPAQPDDGLVRRWSENLPGPERNYGYAVQWFALALLAVVWALWVRRLEARRRSTKPPTQPPTNSSTNPR